MKAALLCLSLAALLCVAHAVKYDNDASNVLDDDEFETLREKFHKVNPALVQLGSQASSKIIVVVPSAKPAGNAKPNALLRFKKKAFASGKLGFVAFAKLGPGAFTPSDHSIRVDTTTEAGLQGLATAHAGLEVVVKFAKDSDAAKSVLVSENNANKCLKANMPGTYDTYVAEYLGSFLSQCIEVKKKKKLKKVGKSGDTLAEIQGGQLDETNLPAGVCSYLIFKKAGTSTVQAYVENNVAHMDFAARLAFGRRITQAFLALLDAGFLHGDAHMENMLVDDNGDHPKWIDISGLKPVHDGAFPGPECASTNARMTPAPNKADAMWYELYGSTEANGQDYASLNKLWGSLGKPTVPNYCINKIHEHLRDTMDAVRLRLQQLAVALPKGQKLFNDFAALRTQVHAWYQPILDPNTNFPNYAPTHGCTTA